MSTKTIKASNNPQNTEQLPVGVRRCILAGRIVDILLSRGYHSISIDAQHVEVCEKPRKTDFVISLNICKGMDDDTLLMIARTTTADSGISCEVEARNSFLWIRLSIL